MKKLYKAVKLNPIPFTTLKKHDKMTLIKILIKTYNFIKKTKIKQIGMMISDT